LNLHSFFYHLIFSMAQKDKKSRTCSKNVQFLLVIHPHYKILYFEN
jgi:hypothetical protein